MGYVDQLFTVRIAGKIFEAGSVLSVEREHSLARVGQTFTVVLKPDAPFQSDLVPWASVVLGENFNGGGLTGYVSSVVYENPPAQIVITGMDKWKLATDYFLADDLLTNEQSLAHWFSVIGLQIGLNISYPSDASDILTPVGIPLGLRPASETLVYLAALGQYSLRMDSGGGLLVERLQLGGPDHVFDEILQGEYQTGDLDTRNVVKIWGWDDEPESAGGQMLYTERVDIDGIVPDRIMVFANPMIDTEEEAAEMAAAALDHFGNLDEISRVEILPATGDLPISVGQIGEAEVLEGTPHRQFITDLRMTLDEGGMKIGVTLGRKQFLLPFFTTQEDPWEPPPDLPYYFFAADYSHVGRSGTAGSAPSYSWEDITPIGLSGRIIDFQLDHRVTSGSVGYLLTNPPNNLILWKSEDLQNPLGPTWTEVYNAGTDFTAAEPGCLLLPEQVPNLVLLVMIVTGGAMYVVRSLDGGLNWTEEFVENARAVMPFQGMAATPNGQRLYLGSAVILAAGRLNYQVLLSNDYGVNWSTYFGDQATIPPFTSAVNSPHALATPWNTGGELWLWASQVQTGPISTQRLYYYDGTGGSTATYMGLEDADRVPTSGSLPTYTRLALSHTNPNVVYTFRYTSYFPYTANLHETLNGGSSWLTRQTGLIDPRGIFLWPSDHRRVWFCTQHQLYYSEDSGVTLSNKVGDWASVMGAAFSGGVAFLPVYTYAG